MLVVSGLAHAGVLALLAPKGPQLRGVATPAPRFEVEVVPMFAPRPAPAKARTDGPGRLARAHRPPPDAAPRQAAPIPSALAEPEPAAPPPPDDLRRVLRRGPGACANVETLGLDRAERDACFEALGRGAATARFIPPPMDQALRSELDEKIAARERMRVYRQGGVPPGGEAHVNPLLGYVPSITKDALKAGR